MAAEDRLTADDLAALAPGDPVTIEAGLDFARRRHRAGTVARITGRHVVVRSGPYVECFGLRDGIREGGAGRAELVHSDVHRRNEARRGTARVDQAYRDWSRSRSDLERLRRLHEAVGQALDEEHAAAVH
ncbi:hypothetical protein [Blastococcus sp. SYSU D01042]